jgi:hypothetical protein
MCATGVGSRDDPYDSEKLGLAASRAVTPALWEA